MALTWTNWNNGDNLLLLRNNLNTFNNNIVTENSSIVNSLFNNTGNIASNTLAIATNTSDIATNTADIATNTADIADHEIRLLDIEDTGMTTMSGNNITPQSLVAATSTKINSFDTILIDVGVGTAGSIALQRMTAEHAGIYKLRYESFVSYASNVTITWQIYKNGVAFGNSITLSGQGAAVFPIILISSAQLAVDDYLELYGTASANDTLTVAQANGTLEKTHF